MESFKNESLPTTNTSTATSAPSLWVNNGNSHCSGNAAKAKVAATHLWDHGETTTTNNNNNTNNANSNHRSNPKTPTPHIPTENLRLYPLFYHNSKNRRQLSCQVSSFDSYLQYFKLSPKAFCLDVVLFPILAGLLMHGPGLKVKWPFEEWPEYLESLLGAAVEGVFLLLLATSVAHAGHCIHGYLSETSCCPNSSKWGNIVLKAYALLGMGLAAWAFGFVLLAILGDATFRVMSGNDSPSAEVLRAGFGDARAHVTAQFQHDLFGTLGRLVFAASCLAGSVYVYVYPLRKQWRYKTANNGGNGGADVDGSTRLIMAGGGAATRQQQHDVESRPFQVSETSSNRCAIWSKGSLPKSKVLQVYITGSILGLAACYFNSQTLYTPVVFAYLSVFCGDDVTLMTHEHQRRDYQGEHHDALYKPVSGGGRGPNVIFLQHESLSGSIMLNTDQGVAAMPFFQDMMHNDPNMYVFEGARTGSGNTIDALPALMTGCLPYDEAAIGWVHEYGRTIGYDFKSRGYSTASFSSRALDRTITSGLWSMLYDLLVGGMDKVVDPLSMNWSRDNAEGSDDRKMLPEFEGWLAEFDNATSTTTGGGAQQRSLFYAQFYNFNQHYPYLKDPKNKAQTHRYFDSLTTTDEFLKRLFEILDRTGRLENTIIVGSGDHGEDPFKENYVRLSAFNSNVLHTASYIYYPKNLMPNPAMGERLRRNTQKMSYTLDMYPTIQSIINGGSYDYLQHAHHGCITGVDLTAVDIPDDRVTISWNMVTSQIAKKGPAQLWALSTKDPATGKELSLYHRKFHSNHPRLKQGKDNWYVLKFNECTRDTSASNLCIDEVNENDKEIFRGAVDWIKNTPMLGGGVRTSKLVEFFSSMVKYEETGGGEAAVAGLPAVGGRSGRRSFLWSVVVFVTVRRCRGAGRWMAAVVGWWLVVGG